MGLKKMFQKKEPTEAELREDLNRVGISTKSSNVRQEKFGAFKNYAQERASMKPGLAPVNPYANISQPGGSGNANPYANGGGASDGAGAGAASSSPYSQQQQSNPYSQQQQSNPYSRQPQQPPPQQQGAYGNGLQEDPYSRRTSRTSRNSDTDSMDLNAIPTHPMHTSRKPVRKYRPEDDDLNFQEEQEYDDLNLDIDSNLPEQEQVNSEDEEIEAIKQDIRFTKQESVQSTRNTLRMAQEADASGTNTLGMLGSQSERLYNAEQNLLLADTQTKIADEKVKQLHRLNRSIFIPASGNPFNKKARLRQQEEKIKAQKSQEKYLRESHRQEMYASEQRIKEGITNNSTSSEVYAKYQGAKDLQAASRYQFENDSEDDEMEKEIAGNLDQIGQYAKKLSSMANTMGKEVESQNTRLRKIEEDADRLDINVHMNNTRLSNIR
ncbi:Protein transport protein SEC9 [Spathaspora sp. JA1]|nr:Protein transport protein SEC9 [Spathaspora sp. JA1]